MEVERDELAPDARTLAEALADRVDGLTDWLRENAPNIDEEQKHLDEGSVETAYWHYGYLMALRDVSRLLGVDAASQKFGRTGTSSSN